MYPAFLDFIRDVWQAKPFVLILFGLGVVVFVGVVIDTFFHRKKRKQRHRIRHVH